MPDNVSGPLTPNPSVSPGEACLQSEAPPPEALVCQAPPEVLECTSEPGAEALVRRFSAPPSEPTPANAGEPARESCADDNARAAASCAGAVYSLTKGDVVAALIGAIACGASIWGAAECESQAEASKP
ncbi:MAG TPA: hypothetical protein VGK73_25660 [Polyangiaceae bacterium]